MTTLWVNCLLWVVSGKNEVIISRSTQPSISLVETVRRESRAILIGAWLQSKVREHGLGLRPKLYAGSVCDAQRRCSCSMLLSAASARQCIGRILAQPNAKGSVTRTAILTTRLSTVVTSPTRERVSTCLSDRDTLNRRSASLLRTSLAALPDLRAPSKNKNNHGRTGPPGAWHLSGGPVGLPARWSNVEGGSGTEDGVPGPWARKEGFYVNKLFARVPDFLVTPLLMGPVYSARAGLECQSTPDNTKNNDNCRCFGYLHPHNPRGWNVAVSAFVLVLTYF